MHGGVCVHRWIPYAVVRTWHMHTITTSLLEQAVVCMTDSIDIIVSVTAPRWFRASWRCRIFLTTDGVVT